ncbi:MAG: ATP-grasp domain-containing protein [Bacteroidales bacterium]|nr:ATP-grasp domain-containing protein [Bacteroidales bacterium]
MVLAGGNDQIELIKGLRNRFPDIEIILIDMNPNVRAREFADRMLVISTMDYDKVLEAARTENIDLILSACGDQPMRTMAYVSEKLGLPCYLSFEQAESLTNKVLMKHKMLDGGIPTSHFRRFRPGDKVDIGNLAFPLVIKPVDNNGSKGIIKVHSIEEFDTAVNEARSFTLCGDLLVEEFKEGEEFSVEAFLRGGDPIIVFASKNRKIKNRNTFTICRNEYVPSLSPSLEKKIKDIVVRIGKVYGVDNVPLLIQMIVDDKENVSVIEFSARTGGGSKLFFIREMCGVDVIDNLIDITIGKIPDVTPSPINESAVINYVYTEPGVFSAIENLKELKESGLVKATYLYKPYGTRIMSSNYSSDRPVGFLITAGNTKDLADKIDAVNREIRILDENGKDIMRHDIFAYK